MFFKFKAAESRPHPLFLPSFELNTLGFLKFKEVLLVFAI